MYKLFTNDSSIVNRLSKNSSIFINLNISTNQMLNFNAMPKLNDLFEIFAEINSNYSTFSKFYHIQDVTLN